MNKEVYHLSTEIWYAQSKEVEISADDWAVKIETLLKDREDEIIKKIEGMPIEIVGNSAKTKEQIINLLKE